ncbi:MAG: acyl-CoA thioesterase [Candidatus Paceibacteria bacterium]
MPLWKSANLTLQADNMTDQAEQQLAEDCAHHMFTQDVATKALNIAVGNVKPGGATATMTVTNTMLNGHKTCHGGMIFTLADSAFAFACNSQNHAAVAAGCTIDFVRPAFEGDQLNAQAAQVYQGKRSGIYHVEVTNQNAQLVAFFKGNSARINGSVLPDSGNN